jgi:hypothetical protein
MGNKQVSWQNQAALNYLQFLNDLLGPPIEISSAPGGIAIWNKSCFLGNTLFGQDICLTMIILKDEAVSDSQPSAHIDCVYVFVHAPVSSSQIAFDFMTITSSCGYDLLKQQLWIRGNSLDTCIAALKVLTDYATNQTTMDDQPTTYNTAISSVLSASTPPARIAIVKPLYVALCANLTALMNAQAAAGNASLGSRPASGMAAVASTATPSSERFMDDPWYTGEMPYYVSNNPGKLALGEANKANFYRSIRKNPASIASPATTNTPPSGPSLALATGASTQSDAVSTNAATERFSFHRAEHMSCPSHYTSICDAKAYQEVGQVLNKEMTANMGNPNWVANSPYSPWSPINIDKGGNLERFQMPRGATSGSPLANHMAQFERLLANKKPELFTIVHNNGKVERYTQSYDIPVSNGTPTFEQLANPWSKTRRMPFKAGYAEGMTNNAPRALYETLTAGHLKKKR